MRRLALSATTAVALALIGCGGSRPSALAPVRSEPSLRIGMTLDEARVALGRRFSVFEFGDTSCAQFDAGKGVGGLATDRRITVVSLAASLASDGKVTGPGPATDRGLRPGDSLRRAIALYGRPTYVAPQEYGGVDVLWHLPDVDGDPTWLRVTEAGDHADIQIGTAPSVFNVEGCA